MTGSPVSNPRAPLRRGSAVVSAVVLIAAGLAVHLLLPDTAGSDIAGDALYAAVVYAALVVIAPRMRPSLVAGIAAAWCIAMELFQLTGIPIRVAEVFSPAVLVLGTVFDPRDLVIYPLAVGVAWVLDAGVRHAVDRYAVDRHA